MTYTLFTCVWKRRSILKLFCDHYDRWEVNKVAVCSTYSDEQFMKSYGWKVVRASNDLLGKKWNAGLKRCMDTDYIIQVGSDDLLSDNYFKAIKPLTEYGVHFAALKSLYFWNSETDECCEFTYATRFKGRKFIGAGRLLSTLMIDHVLEQESIVWTNHINKGLDNDSELRFNRYGYYAKEIEWPHPLVVDVKSDTNIWSYDAFAKTSNKHKHFAKSVSLKEVRDNCHIKGNLERTI